MLRAVIIFFLVSNTASASSFVGAGVNARLTKNLEDNFEAKFPILLYGGFKDIPWVYALEGLYLREKSNSGPSYRITSAHYEMSLYVLRFINYEEARAINPYLAGGLGAYRTHVTTGLLATEEKDKSSINPVAKLGAGAWAQLGSDGFINLEGKGLYSKYFSPEFILEMSVRAGFEFE